MSTRVAAADVSTDQLTAPAEALTWAERLFGRPLVGDPADGRRVDLRSSRTSFLCELIDPETHRAVVYKERHLSPRELLEIAEVLERLSADPPPNVCRTIAFAVSDHRLHLLLEKAQGRSLDHGHDHEWRNAPEFSAFLNGLSAGERFAIAVEFVRAVAGLHARGLLGQDLKLEQMVVADRRAITLLDVDTFVLTAGACAQRAQWGSAGAPVFQGVRSLSVETDLHAVGMALYELFYDDHWWARRVEMGDQPAVDPILRGLLDRRHGALSTAAEVAAALEAAGARS